MELVWDIAASPSLDDGLRAVLLARLETRVDTAGRLRLVAQGERSQYRNREAVIERFATVIAAALVERKKRKATKPTRASKARRLDRRTAGSTEGSGGNPRGRMTYYRPRAATASPLDLFTAQADHSIEQVRDDAA